MRDIINKVKNIKSWYQTVNFDGYVKKGHGKCGDDIWPTLRNAMSKSIKGLKILDLGSNTGIFCVRSAIEGAKVIGIENHSNYIKQSDLVVSYFKEKYNNLDITIINDNVLNVFYDNYTLGKFDVVLGLSVLYHIASVENPEKCKKLVNFLGSITDIVITRYRSQRFYEPYDKYFKLAGFNNITKIEDGKRYFIKYEK